jgi:hypothetical protein
MTEQTIARADLALDAEVEKAVKAAWSDLNDSLGEGYYDRERLRALARKVVAIERERAAKVAEHFAVGIVDRGEMECCGSNEQAWLIERSREIAAAIRGGSR